MEIGISFFLTNPKYDEKTYASYMPSGLYKNLLEFMSNPLFKLEITEDYDDLPLIRQKDEYLMISFVKGRFQKCRFKNIKLCTKIPSGSYFGRHLNGGRYTNF